MSFYGLSEASVISFDLPDGIQRMSVRDTKSQLFSPTSG